MTCPVLVIGGRDDPLATPTVLTELAASLTGSADTALVLVPDAGHALFADQPDAAYGAVRDFLCLVMAWPAAGTSIRTIPGKLHDTVAP